MGVGGHVRIVRDQDDGDALGVEPLEHPQDFNARVRIEVARRLVGQEEHGPIDCERPIATRCCCPPDICDGSWRARSASPTRSSSSSAHCRASLPEHRWAA